MFVDLVDEDCICFVQDFQFFVGDFVGVVDGKFGVGEGVVVDEFGGQVKFVIKCLYFVFEKFV